VKPELPKPDAVVKPAALLPEMPPAPPTAVPPAVVPALTPPGPVTPAVPPVPAAEKPAVPPAVAGSPVTAPPAAPSILPPPSAPDVAPPAALPPAVPATPTAFTKPAGETAVKPAGPPQTSFDVDLYEPRPGDTYEAVAREFYNDARYAAALKEFNRSRALTAGTQVEVPPIHVLKKRYPGLLGGTAPAAATPASRPAVVPASATDDWRPPTAKPPAAAEPAFRAPAATFRVPRGGMTLKAVARHTLGDDRRWNELYQLNPHLVPSDTLPAGTEVRLPPGATVPE
jgi:hypothetical protein